MTKRLRHHIVLHLENLNIIGRIGGILMRSSGLYRRGFQNAKDLNVIEYNVSFKNLPSQFNGYRVMAMGDLHIDGRLNVTDRIKKLVKNTPVDLCLFLGDYREKVLGPYAHVIETMADIVSAIEASDGIYGVRGNHDSEAMIPELNRIGIHMLVNNAVKVERGEQSLFIVGVDDPHFYEKDDLETALQNVPKDSFKILLAHSPEIHWQAAEEDIDFYLCGHTHGGQIALEKFGPIIVNARNSRHQSYRFWKYDHMIGYTTLGVGTSSIPVRFNCPPEIVVFTLHKS